MKEYLRELRAELRELRAEFWFLWDEAFTPIARIGTVIFVVEGIILICAIIFHK